MGDAVGGFGVLRVAAIAAALGVSGCTGATLTSAPAADTTTSSSSTTTRPAVAATLPAGVATRIGPWRLAGRTEVLDAVSDQGLATVARPGPPVTVAYRGTLSVTPTLEHQGWNHVCR